MTNQVNQSKPIVSAGEYVPFAPRTRNVEVPIVKLKAPPITKLKDNGDMARI